MIVYCFLCGNRYCGECAAVGDFLGLSVQQVLTDCCKLSRICWTEGLLIFMTWFRLDSSAMNDEKLIVLRKRHGLEGIGLYFLLVMQCYENKGEIEEYKLPIIFEANEIPKGQAIFSTMVDLRLFQKRGEIYYSKRVSKELQISADYKKIRSEAGRKGGLASAEQRKEAIIPTIVNDSSTKVNHSTVQYSTVQYSTVHTLQSLVKKELTENEINQQEVKFREIVLREGWGDSDYIQKVWSQRLLLDSANLDNFHRKVRMVINCSFGKSTLLKARKIYYEICGLVNDKGLMAKQLTTKELTHQKDAEEEFGKSYVEQEL